MQKEVPRRSSAQAKQIKEHLLSEEEERVRTKYFRFVLFLSAILFYITVL